MGFYKFNLIMKTHKSPATMKIKTKKKNQKINSK